MVSDVAGADPPSRSLPILLYRPGAIGDTLLVSPALRALRQARGRQPIWLIGHPALAALFLAGELVDRYISRDGPEADALFAPTSQLARERLGRLDSAVAWTSDPTGALRRNLSEIGVRSFLIAPSRPLDPDAVHVGQHLLRTLASLTGSDDSLDAWLTSPFFVERTPDTSPGARPSVTLHPGSGSPRKNWPAEGFVELARALARQFDAALTVLLGPADEDCRSAFHDAPVRLLDSPPLLEVAALLARTDLYVGNDSGISHLAGLTGTPSVVLFGPTDPRLWRPLGRSVEVLRGEPLYELALSRVYESAVRKLTAEAP